MPHNRYQDERFRANQASRFSDQRSFPQDQEESRISYRGGRDYFGENDIEIGRGMGDVYNREMWDENRQIGHYGKGPKGWTRSDDRIKDEVCDRLERDYLVDASEIEVDVNDGIVTLSGSAQDRRAKHHAEDVIENLPGVRDVRNKLSIDQSLFQKAKKVVTGESLKGRQLKSRH